MHVISTARDFLRRTDCETFMPTDSAPEPVANAKGALLNAVNVVGYAQAAMTGPVGGVAVAVLGAIKVGAGAVLAGVGYAINLRHGSDHGVEIVANGATYAWSGLENLVVGAAACIPVAGSYIACAMAVRSAADIANTYVPVVH